MSKNINTNITFNIFHADHGISDAQMKYIKAEVESMTDDAAENLKADIDVLREHGEAEEEALDPSFFFIHQVVMDGCDETVVPCGLYGPAMGDDPIKDDEVRMEKRSEDRPPDRLIKADMRLVEYVQAIGVRNVEEDKILLFTVYGGPLAPQNPEDPSLDPSRKAEAVAFWSQHALVG